jgi:uncharacterized protein YkwD
VRIPALICGLTLALASAATAQPAPRERISWPPGFQPAGPADPLEVEQMILDRTNAFRREQGLAELAEDARLTEDARAFARYLARTGRFSHTADGREPSERARAAGYDYCEIAENIAWAQDSAGFRSSAPLAGMLMDGWKTSPGHRRNLLDAAAVQIGVGVAAAPDEPGRYYAVQEFGRPASMSFSFKVANRTGQAATYRLGARTVRIGPYSVITHTTCASEPLVLAASAPVRPAPGAVYLVRP